MLSLKYIFLYAIVYAHYNHGVYARIWKNYIEFFHYGDINNDGRITKEDVHGQINMAWLRVWHILQKVTPPEMVERGITVNEFAELALPGGKMLQC